MHKRTDIQLSRADRSKLRAVVANRNSPQKHVWRAKIILLTAEGLGTNAIMRGTSRCKSVVALAGAVHPGGCCGPAARQERPPGRAPLDAEIIERVVALTAQDPP